ncbi:unnamed protein product [Orchesella dallaii]|uniref:Uncharacterized protein n=1 Tax=Orchesella dallaii TaxID=48710 RepID=A0ABP1R992_9HEXA
MWHLLVVLVLALGARLPDALQAQPAAADDEADQEVGLDLSAQPLIITEDGVDKDGDGDDDVGFAGEENEEQDQINIDENDDQDEERMVQMMWKSNNVLIHALLEALGIVIKILFQTIGASFFIFDYVNIALKALEISDINNTCCCRMPVIKATPVPGRISQLQPETKTWKGRKAQKINLAKALRQQKRFRRRKPAGAVALPTTNRVVENNDDPKDNECAPPAVCTHFSQCSDP